jgi:alpha 1,3-glucosidase
VEVGNLNYSSYYCFKIFAIVVTLGKIIPRKMRLRRSSKLMYYDPLTLVIAPDATGEASGLIYMDDEITMAHSVDGSFVLRSFTLKSGIISCSEGSIKSAISGAVVGKNMFKPTNTVERIVIAGQKTSFRSTILHVLGDSPRQLETFYDSETQVVTIKKPDTFVALDWTIIFEQ